MPVYTYRREDGTTFDIRQKFTDDPLAACPTTGQQVVRIVQNPGVIFKGSGFYVTDNKNGKNGASNGHKNGTSSDKADSSGAAAESKSETATESKADSKPESKPEAKKAATTEKAS